MARRALVASAAGAVGFLLLSVLSHAVAHPGHPQTAVARLLWCAVPLAALAHLAVATVRADPSVRPREGLDAVGVGPARLPLLAAVTAGLYCAVGCALAWPAFVHLRGGLGGALDAVPLAGAAGELLGAGRPLPRAAALTLLAVPPLVAAGAGALATRLRSTPSDALPGPSTGLPDPAAALPRRTPPVPTGLPWGVAVTAVGLAVETYAADRLATSTGPGVPLPGSPPDALGVGVVAGWLVIGLGLVLAGPGLVHLCGMLLAAGRPGVLRLLAGRALREEAPRVGHPLGVLCAVTAGALGSVRLYGTARGAGEATVGPLTVLGAAVVLVCAVAAALGSAAEFRAARAAVTAGLCRLGVSRRLLRAAATLRVVAVLAVLAPPTWLVAELATAPLTR
nr:hypothetical protein [Streptomyces taklimakanensis]